MYFPFQISTKQFQNLKIDILALQISGAQQDISYFYFHYLDVSVRLWSKAARGSICGSGHEEQPDNFHLIFFKIIYFTLQKALNLADGTQITFPVCSTINCVCSSPNTCSLPESALLYNLMSGLHTSSRAKWIMVISKIASIINSAYIEIIVKKINSRFVGPKGPKAWTN